MIPRKLLARKRMFLKVLNVVSSALWVVASALFLYTTLSRRKEEDPVRMTPWKTGKGLIGSYHVSIGAKEARDLGFVDADGTQHELAKTIDYDARTITYSLASDTETPTKPD